MLAQVSENIFKVKHISNNRLAEMGILEGTIFRIVKKVAGMVQLRIGSTDIVIREELFKEIDYDKQIN